ncbi:hypothetical protein K2173_018798 [Erythroxylum novogranatense]|uniref:50S ribosomal protein L14, chloroplastic n=1 Tax=Erythroxylum novogranatense TaxID=1862640 RepID=A0AAV8SB99_9ROSI|nr:hypothetical protein K2173_018798 [Erythroxylum novogranatense]
MIQSQTHLNVAANSRAQKSMCIQIIGVKALPNFPLERSKVIRVVIVQNCKELKCENGMIIRYDDNYDDNVAVVIDQDGNLRGTRIFGAIAQELRQLNFTKNSFIST